MHHGNSVSIESWTVVWKNNSKCGKIMKMLYNDSKIIKKMFRSKWKRSYESIDNKKENYYIFTYTNKRYDEKRRKLIYLDESKIIQKRKLIYFYVDE